jgi:hypothetical protein
MQFAIDLIQKIPAGWPRLAGASGDGAGLFFLPRYRQEDEPRPNGEGDARKNDAVFASEEAAS